MNGSQSVSQSVSSVQCSPAFTAPVVPTDNNPPCTAIQLVSISITQKVYLRFSKCCARLCCGWFSQFYFQFSVKKEHFSSRVLANWPITSTYEHDLDSVQLNQKTKYLGQRPFRSKVIVYIHRHTHTHTSDPTALHGIYHTSYIYILYLSNPEKT